MTMTAMLLIAIAIAVLLYIVVQRLDRIIALQTEQQDLQTDQRNTLIHIADLLEVPYGEELDRKGKERDRRVRERERERDERVLAKVIADHANAIGMPVPEPHASRLQRPPKD
jgi:hypothetical protein